MLTTEEAKSLLEMNKVLEKKKQYLDLAKEKSRFDLISEDKEFKFLLQIERSRKIEFKTTMHHHEKVLFTGLLRIDFKGCHPNPEIADDNVPDFIKPFAGQFFKNIPHIHFFVEGHKPLVWAIPLSASDFPVKIISSEEDFVKAVDSFADYIKLKDKIRIMGALS
jgi:hypothetical protein